MEPQSILASLVAKVRQVAQPERIVLFGSRARGEGRRDSDFDVLVVMESAEPRYRRARRIYAALADLPAEVDVLVYTPGEVQEWRHVPQAFVTTAVREGTVLYERED